MNVTYYLLYELQKTQFWKSLQEAVCGQNGELLRETTESAQVAPTCNSHESISLDPRSHFAHEKTVETPAKVSCALFSATHSVNQRQTFVNKW